MPLVLIVEDNPFDADMLSRRLARKGYAVVTADNGETGIAQARCSRPDLIIMDMGLPVIDGWEATRRLKASPDTAPIPVVALTAHAMTEDRQKCLDAGCDGFEPKPLEFGRLIACMEQLLKKKGHSA
jgi:two-component system, cell cycle response regulator DivK